MEEGEELLMNEAGYKRTEGKLGSVLVVPGPPGAPEESNISSTFRLTQLLRGRLCATDSSVITIRRSAMEKGMNDWRPN
jgi:hypothetical protein